ncbi:Methyltransferase small domain-containing protein [Aeromonas sp. RU39B]|uniref:LPD38 domain-containing protein n=1 Tax=Aeromonas sp. RU39B TaxID=1907416 RepID=UPI000953D491|nr:LPD38 domain-containing protein [Aeromonas sp. RU39B]SIQ71566.1 Methyltransferase small domain-containing protein [Aeromonas sp. RU39B]
MDNSNNGLPHPDQSDTRTQDFWRNLNANINGSPSATTQSDGAGLSDYAKAVGSGALELVGGIGELAKGVQRYGAENAGKSAWGNVASTIAPLTKPVSAIGELAKSGSEKLTGSMSQGAKDAMGRSLVSEDANGNLTLGDGIGDVDVWAMKMANGIGSLLPTIATGGITGAAARVAIGRSVAESMIKRGATKEVAEAVAAKTVERFATTGATTAGVTGSVGSTGQQAKEGVLGMSFDELKGSETFRDAFRRIDIDQETSHLSDLEKLSMAREETANAASQYAMGDAKTWGAAAIGTIMGDTMLFKMLAGKGVGGGVLRGMGKGAAGEGVSEALESGTQQYVANQAQNDVANANIDPMQGVKSAAIEGGVIGAGIGGGVGGIGGLRGGHEQAQPEADNSAEQQPDGQPEAPTPEQTFAPEQAPAESATQPGQQAAEDNQSPLGPSTSKFDPLRDIPAYQRQGFVRGGQDFQGTPIVPLEGELLDHGTGVMPLSDSTELGDPVNRSTRYEAAPNRAALEGQSNEVAGLPYTPAPQQIGQSDTIFAGGEPGADQRNSAYTPPRLSRDHVDTSLGEQSTRDPRSPVSQSIANAGSATDSVFGPLQSLRVTRKGKPFATEKEAAMASRKDQEMPVPLNGGGFGVAQIAEVQQVQAQDPIANTEAPTINTPADQPAAGVSAETVTAPVQAEASQIKQQSNNPEPLDAAKPVAETEQRGLSEEDLKDRDLLKEHAGRWKYRSSVGSGWFTANTKEGAVERAQEAYRKAMSKGESVPTRDERFAQANEDLFSEMDRRYGKMPIPELEAEYRRLGGAVSDLQRAGAGEFNGDGGRRTGAAVSNEGARQTGDERLRLGLYTKMRQEREGVSNDTPTVAPVSSEQQGDQPGAGEPVLPVAEPSTDDGAGVPAADNAGGAAPDAASMESQQDDQALNWSEPKSAEDYRKAQGRLFAGDMSYAEFKAMSWAMLDNAGALRAELEQKTKAELLQMMSAFNAARYKNEKKAAVVEAAYNQLLGDLRWAANGSSNTMSETYSLGGKRQSIEERVSSALDGLTEGRYQQFRDKQRADMAALERRRAALKQALIDPQTLEDFRAFVERRGSDKLTTEQRARYEDLVAASNMDKREAVRDAKAEAKVTATTAGDIIQTKHTKTGEDLFVVQMGERVDRDTYNTVNAKAKEMGGWYSSFRGKGAVPGFQFKDKAKAAEFKAWLADETTTQAKPDAAPTEITEPSNEGGNGKQVETLRQRADSVRAKADAALNAERKENTAKRAGQAAHARANAERDLRFADLLDAIATGIEAGEITYLRNLANGAQLEELQSALNRGLWILPSTKVDELVSQGVIERDNNSRYSWSDKATPEQQVEGVTMPGMDYYTDRLRDAAFKMQSASGFKQAGVKIMSLVKAATNRDSKRVTLSDPELIAKLKAFVNGSDDFSTSTIKDQIAGYSRLERMGITNQTELRAALRELVRLQKGLDKRAPQSDPLAEKTRNLKLRLLNNRNAFIDFFPTPEEHAADLVARAGIEPGMKVLEPSAGHGMLADAARAAGASVDAVELASDLRDILQTKGYPLVGTDFMATEAKGDYDAVIMNPPFSNDMDIDHVRHAYDHLKPGGRLVAIVSSMAGERSNRKNKAFLVWLESLGAEQEVMPEGAFKDSLNPTSVRTKIITISKPASLDTARVSFSKQSQTEGLIPDKHLTRKEAELVTREWLRQYKGVAGIDIQIHATQAEMELALGLEPKEGLIRRAAFDRDESGLHVAADTISSPRHLREILRHEVLAHYGLANVLGGGEYTNLMSRIIASKDDPSMRDVWQWVETHYADEDIGVQAEEVVAHLAELEPSSWRRGWEKVVNWLTKALRAVGFLPSSHVSATEIRSLVEALGNELQGGKSTQEQEGPRFSQRKSDRSFTPDAYDAKAFAKEVEYTANNPDSRQEISMGDTPYVMQQIGLDGIETVLPASVVRKATNPDVRGHSVSLEVLKALPDHLSDPIAIMRSRTEQSAIVSLIEATDQNGAPVIVAIHSNVKGSSRIEVNKIASVYGKDNLAALQRQLSEDLVYLDKERATQWLPTVRLQLPEAGTSQKGSSRKKVLTKEDVVNKAGRNIHMSQTATDSAMDKLSLGIKPDIIDRAKERLEALRGTDKSTVKKWVDRFIKKANTEMLDALAPIKYAEDAAGVTEAGDSGYVAARLASGSAATMQATMLYGLPEWKDGVIQRKAGTGESDALLGIFEGLGKDLHNWLGWMAGHRAEILMKEGRENLLTSDEIAALKALDKGKEAQFQEAKQKWNAVNKAVLDLAEEAGLFTKADRANWESEWYIPFFRESEDGDAMAPFKAKGLANQSAGIKKLKGGTEHTADLLENIFSSTGKLIDASMKNMAAQKIVWNLADTDLIEVVSKPNMMDWRAIKNGRELITVKLEGEDYMLRVNDPDLYRAMTFFDRKPFGKAVQLASKAKRLLTAGVTASPEFMFRNFMRDSLSAWAISKDGFKPVVDSIKGIRKTLAMDGNTLDVMFSGASFLGGYVNGNDPGAMADSVRKALRRKGMTPEQISKYEKSIIRNAKQAQEVIAGAWDKYAKYGEAFENANREAVYDAAIKAGKSHAQAAFEAKDLMDFSMLGASRSMQLFVQLLPFFNARVQGLGKLGRELRDNPRAIAKRAGMITAASLALLAMNWDDDRYKDLPDWDKDANWHFFFGDQHFRIPKPFEIGVMFATIPERMVRGAGGADTGAQFGKALARSFMDTFALNPTPQVVKPLVESYFNYDTFRGAPIENMADLAVRAEARYNENTSLLMREIGQATGMSPKKLEHLMIGYTGTIGSYVMAAADGLIRAMSPGESAAWRADEIPVVKAFYRGSAPAKSTQQMDQFYSMLDEVNKLKRTIDQYRKEGMTDEAKALLDEQGGILRARGNLTNTQTLIRQLRNEMELIQRSKVLTSDQKRERLDKLMARRNRLVASTVKHGFPMWY